jgi:hypothetical protein
MNKTDKIIFGSILCAFFPFFISLIGLAIGFYFFNEKSIPYFLYLPLLYALALQDKDDKVTIFNDKPVGDSLTMTSIRIGADI